MKKCLLLIVLSFATCLPNKENSQGESFSKNIDKVKENIKDDSHLLAFFDVKPNPIKPTFQTFTNGSILPKGWILEMMQNDLNKGIVGALPNLYPGIKADDLYNTARRGGMQDIPEMGDLVLTGEPWEKSIMWWNAETIGNWWDGFVRHAFLTENEEAIKESHKIIENLLNSQDSDGYIGIYKSNLRYKHEGSNGELWAQTTAFRTMLAYYEFTKDKRVLNAVEKAMQLTMKKYSDNGKNPFDLKNAYGGVTHGLMISDVCETLHQITGKEKYNTYAIYLYKAFSTFSINRSFNDLRYTNLKEKDSLFEGHGVHTYEHIRTLVNAYYNTGYKELDVAYQNMLYKLSNCILPSGAGHGDEWILKKYANPDETASEYCTMVELRNSYGSLLQKTGDVSFADAAEKLTYNALLGARNENGTAISYSKYDNSFVVDGKHHNHDKTTPEPRYKYSPTHSEPAVCCVPNYGRNLSYFVNQMYMKKKDTIALLIYGPSELTTEINRQKIFIEQETKYPWENSITLKVKTEKPLAITLQFRKPKWTSNINFSSENNVQLNNDFYTINKVWKNDETITLTFKNKVKLDKAYNDEYFIQKGPLVYALDIPHKEETIKTYAYQDFKDYYCYPTNDEYKYLEFKENQDFHVARNSTLETKLYHTNLKKEVNATLIPMGKTVLKRITFPKN